MSIGQAAVWQHDHEWTEHDENAYAEWVKTKFNPEIFWRTGAYPNVSTDCADAVYGMRMIYAFENKLPFVIRSGGGFLSNETSRYDAIQDPRARFRAFMKNVMDITNTTTLSDDTYPIEISREAITPGTMHLNACLCRCRRDRRRYHHNSVVHSPSESSRHDTRGSFPQLHPR